MSSKINTLYEFGGFRFDAESNTLWQGEKLISLPPKALDLLALLLEKEGKVVSKQEILNIVWAETFVEEGVLTQNIYKLRNALGRDENGRQFIENIPRRGYRLTVPIESLPPDEILIGADLSDNKSLTEEKPDLTEESFLRPPLNIPAELENKKNFRGSEKKEKDTSSKLRTPLVIGLGVFLLALISFGIYQFSIQPGKVKKSSLLRLNSFVSKD